MKILAKRIKSARKLRGLSQEELADKVGVNVYSISKWETGARRPDPAHLAELSMMLNVDVDYLLGVTDIPGTSSYALTDETVIELYFEGKCNAISQRLDEYFCLKDETRALVDNLIRDLYKHEQNRENLSRQMYRAKITPTEYGKGVLTKEIDFLFCGNKDS